VAGGSITLSRTVISGTKGGGLFITGGSSNNAKFNIVGNAFMANGESAHSTIGGVKIDTSAFADNRFEFNTVLQNKTNTSIQSGIPTIAGIQCDVPDFVAKNNIVWDNNSQLNNNMPPGPDQVSGTCKYSYSDLGPAGVPTLNDSDGTNFNVNPPFLNESTDYHLQPANQVQQSADPMADLTGIAATDIDGDARVKPATLGADQVSP
jgi:hypothetical protein